MTDQLRTLLSVDSGLGAQTCFGVTHLGANTCVSCLWQMMELVTYGQEMKNSGG